MKKLLPILLLLGAGIHTLSAQKVVFQDSKSLEPIRKERTLILLLPILEFDKIIITARDPFVSADVKDPYVINAPTELEEDNKIATNELIQLIQNTIKETLSNSIKIIGVSSGEPGKENYALIEGSEPDSDNYDGGPRIKKEGDIINIRLNQSGIQELQKISLLAAQEGFQLDVGINIPRPKEPTGDQNPHAQQQEEPTLVEVTLEKIDRRRVLMKHNVSGEEFEILFKKNLGLRGDNSSEGKPNPSGKPAQNGSQVPRPPKI